MSTLVHEFRATYAFMERNAFLVKCYLSMIFYWITDVIAMERWVGTIVYTLMAPIRRVIHMAGQIFFAVIYSLIFSAIILAVTVVFFEIGLSSANMFGGTLMLIVGSLSFIGVDIMSSTLPLLYPERGSQMTHMIIAIPSGLWVFGMAERYAKRAGRLHRNG